MTRTVRAFAFVAAVIAHIGLVALLMNPSRRAAPEIIDAPHMVLVFLEPTVSDVPAPSAPVFRSPAGPVLPEIPLIDESSAITLPPEAEVPANPPPIDWQQESRTAAANAVQGLEAERRRTRKPEVDPRFAPPPPRAPEFGWDQSRVHRIQALPGGGTVIHLNDRCSLTLSGFLIPMCKLGKIEARGDLFDHIGDRPLDDGR